MVSPTDFPYGWSRVSPPHVFRQAVPHRVLARPGLQPLRDPPALQLPGCLEEQGKAQDGMGEMADPTAPGRRMGRQRLGDMVQPGGRLDCDPDPLQRPGLPHARISAGLGHAGAGALHDLEPAPDLPPVWHCAHCGVPYGQGPEAPAVAVGPSQHPSQVPAADRHHRGVHHASGHIQALHLVSFRPPIVIIRVAGFRPCFVSCPPALSP